MAVHKVASFADVLWAFIPAHQRGNVCSTEYEISFPIVS